MNRLGIEMLSVFDMPPAEYVNFVADLGCRYTTAGLVGFAPVNVLGYPPFSLRDDATLRRELLAVTATVACRYRWGKGYSLYRGPMSVPTRSINSLRSLLWPPIVPSRPVSNPLSA
jgi:hypothetical protein